MQSVVHQPVQIPPAAARRPSTTMPWAPTVRLGLVTSVLAVLVAVVVHVLTPLPTAVIVAALAAGAFAVSWHASATRPRRGRHPEA